MVEYELNSDFYNLSSSLELFINQNHRDITALFVITDSITSEFEEFDMVVNNNDKSFVVYHKNNFISFKMKGDFNKIRIDGETIIISSTKKEIICLTTKSNIIDKEFINNYVK